MPRCIPPHENIYSVHETIDTSAVYICIFRNMETFARGFRGEGAGRTPCDSQANGLNITQDRDRIIDGRMKHSLFRLVRTFRVDKMISHVN